MGRKHKLQWQEWLTAALLVEKVPKGLGSVRVQGELRFKQRRRRDEGNFRVILEKALGDALVSGGWLGDDTSDLYRFDRLELSCPWPTAETEIKLFY